MSEIRVVYILLHLFEIWMFFVAGKKMSQSKTDREYWKASLWAFIPYVIVLGLRFGHSIDWNYYCIRYLEHTTMDWDTTEPVYHFIFYIFNACGIPYFLFISFQVAFFLFSFLLIAKHFRNCLYYVLPLLPVVAQSNDNYIRWYLAVSFVLIGFYMLLTNSKTKLFKCIIFFICAIAVHNGSVILVLLIPAYYLLKDKYLPPIISVIAVFISVFFMSIAVVGHLSDLTSLIYFVDSDLVNDSKVSGYLLKVDEIAEGGLSGVTGISTYSMYRKIMMFISLFPIILYGPKFLKRYKYGILYYNLFVIGAF